MERRHRDILRQSPAVTSAGLQHGAWLYAKGGSSASAAVEPKVPVWLMMSPYREFPPTPAPACRCHCSNPAVESTASVCFRYFANVGGGTAVTTECRQRFANVQSFLRFSHGHGARTNDGGHHAIHFVEASR